MKTKIADLKVSPYNVRNVSDIVTQGFESDYEESVVSLAEDIKTNGLINKIVLTKGAEGTLEIVAGSRRRKALESLYGPDYILDQNEYIVKDLDKLESLKISISENQQRYDLTPLELCSAVKKLEEVKPEIDGEELAKILGLSVSKLKRIVDLEQDIRKGKVPEKALKELAKKPEQKPAFTDKHWAKVREEEPEIVEEVVETVVDQEIPAKDVEKVVEKKKRGRKKKEADAVKFDAPVENEGEKKELDIDIKYHYKGHLRLVEEDGKYKLFVLDPKTGEEKIDMRAMLEYLRQPSKFKCEVNFRMKVIPLT